MSGQEKHNVVVVCIIYESIYDYSGIYCGISCGSGGQQNDKGDKFV